MLSVCLSFCQPVCLLAIISYRPLPSRETAVQCSAVQCCAKYDIQKRISQGTENSKLLSFPLSFFLLIFSLSLVNPPSFLPYLLPWLNFFYHVFMQHMWLLSSMRFIRLNTIFYAVPKALSSSFLCSLCFFLHRLLLNLLLLHCAVIHSSPTFPYATMQSLSLHIQIPPTPVSSLLF